MSQARETILRRIHTALRDVPNVEQAEEVPVARDYRHTDQRPHEALIKDFAERVAEYKATVYQCSPAELSATIATALQTRGAVQVVVPADLPAEWLPTGLDLLADHGQLSYNDLDASDGVITAAAIGIAQTGTIALDHSARQGRRAISLVPDYHVCVIFANQIVGVVPEAMSALEEAAQHGQPITFISGPSATSDIELNRVEGVHGPRTLAVVIVD